MDIFFDEMPVHGDLALGESLFAHAYRRGHGAVGFAKLPGETLTAIPNPFSLFGNFKSGQMDLKLHGLFPVTAFARTLTTRHNIAQRSTRARLEGLIERGIGGESELTELMHAQALCMGIILDNQSRDISAGRKASNIVDLSTLSRARKSDLKDALRRIQSAATLVRG